MTQTVSARLRAIRNELGKKQSEMSSHLGLGKNSWQRWELNNSIPPGEVLQKLSEDGISIDWLITGRGGMRGIRRDLTQPGELILETFNRALHQKLDEAMPIHKPEYSDDEFVLVPRYDIQASAGPGAFNDAEQIIDWLAFSRSWVRLTLRVDPKWLVLLSAVGDSMEPTIRAGDLLLIDRSVGAFRDDAIYVLQIAGQLMVKRVQRFFGGAVVVKSDNSTAYVEQTLSREEAEAAQVAGRVRWIGRMI